jgi:hypothetical protein
VPAPHAPRPRVLTAGVVVAAATLSLAACSSPATGHLAVSMDPAGRLVAVVALCDGQRLATLTLTDETSGAVTTVRTTRTPAFGGTVILTGPVGDPRPEGAFDLLDRSHRYAVGGTTAKLDSDEETGTLAAVRFSLDGVVKDTRLRKGSVLAGGTGTADLTERNAFVTRAREACG